MSKFFINRKQLGSTYFYTTPSVQKNKHNIVLQMKAAHIITNRYNQIYTILGVRNTYTALYSIIHIHKMNHIYYAHNNL